ncbi:hypothetical protein [Streptomyces chryseus]
MVVSPQDGCGAARRWSGGTGRRIGRYGPATRAVGAGGGAYRAGRVAGGAGVPVRPEGAA